MIRSSRPGERSCLDDQPTHQAHDPTAALAIVAVAAVISYGHAYELVRSHDDSGPIARPVPFTVDGQLWAASMLILDANRPVPQLACWWLRLGAGAGATIGRRKDSRATAARPSIIELAA